MAAFPKLKLTYFDIPGLAESIRLTFHLGGVPFVDERLTDTQFQHDKAAGRFKNGQVPVLDVDGVQIAQSNAILIYAGKLAGLYPWEPLAALKVEEFLSTVDDIGALFRPSYGEQDLVKRAALRGELAQGPLKTWVQRIDAQIAKNPAGYVTGQTLTIADVRLFALCTRRVDGIPADYFHQFSHVYALVQKIAHHPLIEDYYARHASPKIKLTYFKGRGRAQATRYALTAAGIPFIDERLDYAEFGAAKAAGRFKNGQLPVIEVDGKQVAQSNAILVLAGKLGNLYPHDPLAALKVEEFLSTIDDIIAIFSKTWAEPDLAKRAVLRGELANGPAKAWFQRIDNWLSKSTSGFIVGNLLTVADLSAYAIWTDKQEGIAADYFDQFPHIAAHKKKIAALPKIAAYDAHHH